MASNRVNKKVADSFLRGSNQSLNGTAQSMERSRSKKKTPVYAQIRPRGSHRISASILSPAESLSPTLSRSKSSSEGNISTVDMYDVLPWSYTESVPYLASADTAGVVREKQTEMIFRESDISLDACGRMFETIGGVEIEMLEPSNRNIKRTHTMNSAEEKNHYIGAQDGDNVNVPTTPQTRIISNSKDDTGSSEDKNSPQKPEQTIFRQNALKHDSKDSTDQDALSAPEADLDACGQTSSQSFASLYPSTSDWARVGLSRQDSIQSSVRAMAGSPPLTSEDNAALIEEVETSLTELQVMTNLDHFYPESEPSEKDAAIVNGSLHTAQITTERLELDSPTLISFSKATLNCDQDVDTSGGVPRMTSTPLSAFHPQVPATFEAVLGSAETSTASDMVSFRVGSGTRATTRPERVCSVYEDTLMIMNEADGEKWKRQTTARSEPDQTEDATAAILPVSVQHTTNAPVMTKTDSSIIPALSSPWKTTVPGLSELDQIPVSSAGNADTLTDAVITKPSAITSQPMSLVSQSKAMTSESPDASQSPQLSSQLTSVTPHPSPILCHSKRDKTSAGSSRSVSFSLTETENMAEPKSPTQPRKALETVNDPTSCSPKEVVVASASVTTEGENRLGKVMQDLRRVEESDSGYSLKDLAVSGLSVISGGVKDVAKLFYSPFRCCRAQRQPEEPRVIRHQFRLYHFRRPHVCYVCKQQVYNQGSACQVCRYICHRRCELEDAVRAAAWRLVLQCEAVATSQPPPPPRPGDRKLHSPNNWHTCIGRRNCTNRKARAGLSCAREWGQGVQPARHGVTPYSPHGTVMLKFVHTKPPRARSTSPAASPLPGFDGAPLSPRARDQSDPPHPSYRIRPSEADVGPWPADIGSRPTSPPGIPRTTYGAGPVRTPPPPPPHEGAHFVTDDYEDLVPWRPPVAIERTRVSFPTQSEFFSVRPFPVSDVDWDRRPLVNPAGLFPYGNRYSESQPVSPTVGQLATAHSSGEPPSERYRLGSFSVTQRKPSWQPEHTTEGGIPLPTAVETQRQKPFVTYRTGQLYSRPDSLSDWERLKVGRFPVADSDKEKPKPAPKERHVRIAPYPAEEIFIGPGSSRPRASGRDRSGSPPVTVPHSILSKHSRDRTQHRISPPSSAEERPCRSPGTIGVSLSSRERTPSPEERQLTAARPSAWGAHLSSWARHEDGASKSGVKGKKGGKCAEKADKKGNQRTEGDQGTKEKFWRPKLFSWLHGPSRHKIFASKSAQPAPPVMTSCVPQVSNDLSSEALNKSPYDRSIGQSSQGSRSVMSGYKDALNRSQDGTDELLMDLTYVTERIISMSFPSEGHDTTYAFTLKDVVRMLKTKHGDNYLVLNLSEKRQDLVKANPQVKDYGWPDHLAPPLERLCSVCKAIDAWLNADSRNVAVLHCKGGRARIAIIIAAYMHYSNICASADQALDRFAMKRFCEDKLGGLPLPSQRRYVHYFAGLLSGAIKINSNPLYLHHILIHGVPNYDSRGGCRPFIKVYQGMQPIFTSGVYNVTDNMQKVCISISPGIPLRGDILIKCYHKKTKTGQREIIWQCQFHTCAIQDGNVVFSKQELDDGFNDPRFPDNGKVEFVFGATSDVPVSVSGFKSDVTVPVDDNEDSLTRSDSYENFHKVLASQGLERSKVANGLSTQPGNRGQTGHIQGHWDGSLYTTVNKQRREELEATGLTLNGAPLQANGSLTSSVDSGYVGPRDTSYGSQHHQSELHSSSYTSQLNSVRSNYSSSGLTHTGGTTVVGDHMTYNSAPRQKASVPPLEERSQLDELLSDLLSDQVNVTTSPTSPRSPPGPQSPTGLSNSQQNTMKGAKTVTTTTRTYHTYTSTDSGAGRSNPDKVLIQRAEVTYKVPGQGEERQLYTIAGEPPELEKPRVPENAFTYTPASSTQIGQSHSFQTVERDINRTERVTGLQQSPPSHTQILPYRTDYETRYNVSEIQNYNTLDSDQTSWLHEQRQKLQRKRDGRDSSGRTEQEKQLVNELRFAQNRYHGQQSYNERDAKSPVDPYHQPPLHNGPISPSSMPVNSAPPPREFGGETGHFSTYSQSQYMESQYSSGGERSGTKPPPSPTSQRLMGPLPVQPPARTSSKDYMRSRSHSSSSNVWQTLPSDNRPIARQYSETVLDRDPEPLIQPHHSPSARNAPQVSSPGRPVGPTATTTYTTYRTIHKELRDEPMSQTQQQPQLQPVVAAPPVQAPPPQPQPPPDKHSHHNYITEVFVHRVGGDKKAPDNTDSMEDTRLDELTRSLQAATESIMEERMSTSKQQQSYQQSSSSWQEQYQSVSRINVTDSEYQPTPRMSSASESSRSRSASPDWDVPANNNQVQKSHEGPPPKPVEMIEEDRISLRPIGPGMQTLEPEISHSTSTLNRATTPTFPTSPATPPFPVSPRAVHRSAVRPANPVFYSRSMTSEVPTVSIQRHESSDTLTGLPPVFESTETLNGNPAALYYYSDPFYGAIPARRRASSGAASFSGGSSVVSPMGTMSSSQSYSQHYHQQYNQQGQQQDGSLHIDTSNRMLSPHHARSPSSGGSPHSPGNLNTLRQELSAAHAMSGNVVHSHSLTGQSSPSVYFGLSRRGSMSSLAESDMMIATPKFVKDTSKYWYKPSITRDDAIIMLRDKAPGTFVIRDSNSFPGAYGLALKVAQLPPNVQAKPTNDPQAELVRHFLIEPTPKGVRLRGCSNEPVFGSLAALVYQHSITPLALPCKLSLPDIGMDVLDAGVISPEVASPVEVNLAADLLAKGAACNVIFINTVDTESLTGPQAIAKAIKGTIESQPVPKTTVVHFKVSNQGITLTDNQRKLFFRRHYPVSAITYCGMDPQDRRWKRDVENSNVQLESKIFGFVARKQGGGNDNACHLFAELDPEQPASAIVNFITKVMIGQSKIKS